MPAHERSGSVIKDSLNEFRSNELQSLDTFPRKRLSCNMAKVLTKLEIGIKCEAPLWFFHGFRRQYRRERPLHNVLECTPLKQYPKGNSAGPFDKLSVEEWHPKFK